MKLRHLALLIPLAAGMALTACGGSDDPDPIEAATQRCQDTVSDYAKYPGSIDWVEVRLAQEQNGKIYINGAADADNDAGNPVRTNYSCTLNTETDDWDRRPSMEPKNPTSDRWGTARWGGEASPMLEKYGDRMSMQENPLG
jgi:hypothetical protein